MQKYIKEYGWINAWKRKSFPYLESFLWQYTKRIFKYNSVKIVSNEVIQ